MKKIIDGFWSSPTKYQARKKVKVISPSAIRTHTPHNYFNMLLVNQKDTVLQVHLLREVHFTGDGGENETFLPAVGQGELNLSVQTTRT